MTLNFVSRHSTTNCVDNAIKATWHRMVTQCQRMEGKRQLDRPGRGPLSTVIVRRLQFTARHTNVTKFTAKTM